MMLDVSLQDPVKGRSHQCRFGYVDRREILLNNHEKCEECVEN